MNAQLLELLIFAGIALFFINKLLNTVGQVDEDDPMKKQGFFGEEGVSIKDVTNTAANGFAGASSKVKKFLIDEDMVDREVLSKLAEIPKLLPDFEIGKFLNGATKAFPFIVGALKENNQDIIARFVDNRFREDIWKITNEFSSEKDYNIVNSKIVGCHILGHAVTLCVEYKGTCKGENFKQEWTFNRNALSADNIWYLSNIDIAK